MNYTELTTYIFIKNYGAYIYVYCNGISGELKFKPHLKLFKQYAIAVQFICMTKINLGNLEKSYRFTFCNTSLSFHATVPLIASFTMLQTIIF